MSDMPTNQQIFAVFFAILFGAMLSSLKGFVAFPWGQALSSSPAFDDGRIYRRRLSLSILILNVLPIVLFAIVFRLWGAQAGAHANHLSVWTLLRVALSAMGVYAPYRFFHGVITCRLTRNWFYRPGELWALRRERAMVLNPFPHFISAAIYALVSVCFAWHDTRVNVVAASLVLAILVVLPFWHKVAAMFNRGGEKMEPDESKLDEDKKARLLALAINLAKRATAHEISASDKATTRIYEELKDLVRKEKIDVRKLMRDAIL